MTSGPSDDRAAVIDYLVALRVLRSAPSAEELSNLGSAPEPASGNAPQGAPAAPRHVFAGLRAFGRKVQKFKQRRSTRMLTEEGFGQAGYDITPEELERHNLIGYCVGISMKWAALKIAPPGPDAAAAAAEVEQREDDIHEQNAQFVFDGALGKLKGLRDYAEYAGPLQAMLAQFGVAKQPGDRFAGILHPPGEAQVPAATALAQACGDGLLPPGAAVIASLTVTRPGVQARPGHVVSLHRDRDGTLRFFDPNAGEYVVDQPGPFFATWIQSYRDGRGAELEFDTSEIIDGFYRIEPLSPPDDSDSETDESDESDEDI